MSTHQDKPLDLNIVPSTHNELREADLERVSAGLDKLSSLPFPYTAKYSMSFPTINIPNFFGS